MSAVCFHSYPQHDCIYVFTPVCFMLPVLFSFWFRTREGWQYRSQNQYHRLILPMILILTDRLSTAVLINNYSFILRYYLDILSTPTDTFMSNTSRLNIIYTTFVTAATCNVHRISQFQRYLMLMFSWCCASYMLFHTSTSFCRDWSLVKAFLYWSIQ